MLVDGASASASEAHTTLQGVALCGDGVAWCGCEWVFQIWMVLSMGSEWCWYRGGVMLMTRKLVCVCVCVCV